MSLLKTPIERKLSALLGATVSIEKLNISLLAGSLEALGIRVTALGSSTPVLTIGRVRAEIAVAKAIKGEIVVKSLVVERPMFTLTRFGDGTTNLPRRSASTPNDAQDLAESTDSASKWRFEARKILLVDGAAHFRAGDSYHLSAQPISGEFKLSDDGYDLVLLAEAAARHDRLADLGPIRIIGRFAGVTDIARLSTAPLTATAEMAQNLRLKVDCPSLLSRHFSTQLEGKVDIALLALLLPIRLPLLSGHSRGHANISLSLTSDPGSALIIHHLTLSAADVALG